MNEEQAAHEAPQERPLPPGVYWNPETAAEAGRKSGETRRRRAAMTPEERAFDAIGQKLGQLTGELMDAALGQGDFKELKLETRVTALTRLLEWRLGRPGSVKPKDDEPEEGTPSGEELFK